MIMDDLTQIVIGCAFEVHNELGCGFLEKTYENALLHELMLRNIETQQQVPVNVTYKGNVVGEFVADIVVENRLICELKAVSHILPVHEVQLVNYLTATKIEVGLLINFSNSVEVKRKYRVFKKSCQSC